MCRVFTVVFALLWSSVSFAAPIQWSGNGHYYDLVFPDQNVTWFDASQLAAQSIHLGVNGHLATTTSQEENAFLRDTFGALLSSVPNSGNPFDVDSAWIGLTDFVVEGTYLWHAGEPFSYADWWPGEPNNLGNEDFVMIWRLNDQWGWVDALDFPEEAYFVEYDVVPEPSSLLLGVLAGVGLMLYCLRRA